MPVNIDDRPVESVREEVIDQLTMNYSHGEISLEAFERRLDQAMETEDNRELMKLVEDLDLKVDQAFNEKKQETLSPKIDTRNPKETDEITQILSSTNRRGAWKVAKETTVYCLLSSVEIDLSEAVFTHQSVHIKVYSLFSSCDIYTPEKINVVSKVLGIVGSTDNQAPSIADSRVPTVVVEGVSILSSIDIQIKQSLKEKLMKFADSLKKMFV